MDDLLPQPIIVRDEARARQGLCSPADEALARDTAALLLQHYPGWPWAITAMADQGVVIVKNLLLHAKWGYVVKLGQADTPSDWRRTIVNAGGELLEAWGCPRGALSDEAFAAKRKDADVLAELKRLEHLRRVAKGLAA